MTLPAPVVNRLVALENSIPQAVVNTVSKSYPLSVPVVLGRKLAGSERTILRWTANELLNYDEGNAAKTFAQHSNIQNTPCGSLLALCRKIRKTLPQRLSGVQRGLSHLNMMAGLHVPLLIQWYM